MSEIVQAVADAGTPGGRPLAAALAAIASPPAPPDAPGVNVTSSTRLPLPVSYAATGGELPGRYPYTRGIDAGLYQDETWVMGQYSGYATPKETNERFKQLLASGGSGLSVALDLPTQMGMDSDDPRAAGEVGKVGVSLDSVEDLKNLLDGVPLERVRQMRTTANAIGPVFVAFLLVALEELGADPRGFRLLMQNDSLKEYFARGTYIYPPEPARRLSVDVVEFFAEHHPHWEPIEFCGYHIRDAGGSAVHEIAFAICDGIAYLEEARRRGIDLASFTPQCFFHLASAPDVFEEAAKFRAARRVWAHVLHEHFGVPEEACAINIFAYTLGGALHAQEPLNNAIRVAYETFAAAIGGIQTLATSSYDEALGLPTLAAAHLALRTQQIAAHESGATKVVDPLAGSYYVEDLTNRLAAEIAAEILRVDELGGALEAIATGYYANVLADNAYEIQKRIDSGEDRIVAVNTDVSEEQAHATEVFRVREERGQLEEQRKALARVRSSRDPEAVERALSALADAAAAGRNSIPPLLEAARARVTIGEITETFTRVFGRHTPAQTIG
jgi:methylmalonyl-CoA mutase N-terminal domain/subunit